MESSHLGNHGQCQYTTKFYIIKHFFTQILYALTCFETLTDYLLFSFVLNRFYFILNLNFETIDVTIEDYTQTNNMQNVSLFSHNFRLFSALLMF
jgi:hypothetical protein